MILPGRAPDGRGKNRSLCYVCNHHHLCSGDRKCGRGVLCGRILEEKET